MILPVVFHPSVEEDVADAYRWYETRRAGLGETFLAAIDRAHARLHTTLESSPVIYSDCVRRILIFRFPYGIYYRILDQRVEVVAIQHTVLSSAVWHPPEQKP